MKYIKKFEAKEKIILYMDISLFPNHTGLMDNEEPTTGTWTTFWGDSHIREIGQKYANIIWRKYFGRNDKYEKDTLGPSRPVFETYPDELADVLIYLGDDNIISEYIEKSLIVSKEKKYWRYSNVKPPIDDNDEVSLELKFDSKEEALNWLDMFEFALNDPDYKENVKDYMAAKKYNL